MRAVPRGRGAPGLQRALLPVSLRWWETCMARSRGMGRFSRFGVREGVHFWRRMSSQVHSARVRGSRPGLSRLCARLGSRCWDRCGVQPQCPGAQWRCRWGGGLDPAAFRSPAAWVQELHLTPAPAQCPALTRCNSPAHFSPCDLPSVNSSLT